MCHPCLILDHLQAKHPDATLTQLEHLLLGVFRHYKRWCKNNKISASSLRFNLSRFGRESWQTIPELSSQYKASTVKIMQYWLAHYLLEEPAVPGAGDRRCCSYALAMFQFMLDSHKEWFVQGDAVKTADYGYKFLLFYQKLAGRSRAEPKKNFKVVPKFHYFFHMLEYIERTLRNVRRLGTS